MPTRHIRAYALGIVAGTWSSSACQPATPEFPSHVVYDGKYLQYVSTIDTRICQGSFRVQETYVQELASLINVQLTMPIRYALIAPSEHDYYCLNANGTGCYYDGKTFSSNPVSYHELAHAVLDAGGYHGPASFQEGLAEVFGNGMNLEKPQTDLEEVLKNFPEDNSGYYTMALFARFLIEEYGIERLLEFMNRTDLGESYTKFAPKFEDVFELGLDAAIADFGEYPLCSRWENRYALVECFQTPEIWDGDMWQASMDLDCGQDDVLGPLSAGGLEVMWTERALDIETTGDFFILPNKSAEWSKISLTRCGSCWDALEIVLDPRGEPSWVTLPAGRYHVLFAKYTAEPGPIGFVMQRLN